jgi:glycosyltransferase involved in cell wall biosynthesis
MNSPLFTVIICNYNYGKYVGEAIESVLSQTHADFELIVVDDGSTDNSREIIESIFDNRLKIVFKKNGGQASAFNVAMQSMTGQLVAFLDSDDLWKPNKLEAVFGFFEDENIIAVQHACEVIDKDGKTLKREHPGNPKKVLILDSLKMALLGHGFPGGVPTSSMVFRSSALKKVFPINDSYRICADMPLRNTFILGLTCLISNKLTDYRIHGNNGYWDNPKVIQATEKRKKGAYYELCEFAKKELGLKLPKYIFTRHFEYKVRVYAGIKFSNYVKAIQRNIIKKFYS